ncbi:lysozyme [Delftia acidovorans]|uniref:Lysozyme n=1 Tax=Delftia acidovorans TaxID=80866 RepID=A0AAJ2R8W3_DELAC|nr:endolysin [Delftia acidovorans]MDX4957941.1 endolysin [Delftia acidovorans]
MSKIPAFLTSRLAALAILAGLGGTGAYVAQQTGDEALRDQYVQTVASDQSTSNAVKVAMVLGQYYESSGKHIGTPYVDKLGRGQPLTVCNGITGAEVVAARYYSPSDCYYLERGRYLAAEQEARRLFARWGSYDPFVQGQFIDFVHNKGAAALASSTLLRKANAGDLAGACRENTRWNRGTVAGVSAVLPGLQLRGDANAEICLEWRTAQ